MRAIAIVASVAFVATTLASPMHAAAKPGDARECLAAHEQGQAAQASSRLREARQKFVACAAEGCPVDVRKECSDRLREVDARLPTIVVEARVNGSPIADARVSVDGTLVADKLTGVAAPVDPGTHALRVECTGGQVREQSVLVSEGDKLRRVVIDCDTAATPATAGTTLRKSEEPTAAHAGGIPTGTWILGGVAIAALGGFATFAALGRSKESSLAGSCSPTCTDHEVAPARTQYLIADVSLLVAVLSGAGAAVIALWPKASAERSATR